MLNRHPAFALCDETYFFYYVHGRRRAFGDLGVPQRRQLAVDRYLATNRIQRLGLDLSMLRERLLRDGTSYDALFASLLLFYAESHGSTRPGEKTPHHAWHTATLLDWYADAKVLHLVRDPRDVVASLLRMPWGRRSVLANARLWVSLTQAAERCSTHPRWLRLRYEELIRDPEQTLIRACAFLDEEYEQGMLEPDPSATTDKPWFERAYQRVARDRVGLWEAELSARQVQLVEWLAGSTMKPLGYAPAGVRPGVPTRAAAIVHELAEGMTVRLRRAPHAWYYWLRPTELAAEEEWLDR